MSVFSVQPRDLRNIAFRLEAVAKTDLYGKIKTVEFPCPFAPGFDKLIFTRSNDAPSGAVQWDCTDDWFPPIVVYL